MIVHVCVDLTGSMADDQCVMRDRAFSLETKIRERRRSLGLNQVELAELAGCSTRFIHKVEAGEQTVRLDKVLDVMTALGLRLVVAGPGE